MRFDWKEDAGMRKMITGAAAAGLAAALAGCGSLDSSKTSAARADLKALRITELHYHPADEGAIPGDEFEFIEIKNTGTKALDLTDVGFTEGIEFTFEKGTTVEAGRLIVVASVPARFKARYGFEAEGPYTGQLSNSGETIRLEDKPAGAVIDSLTYSDQDGWPGAADGGGYSIVPRSPSDPSAKPWRLSTRLNGSPGRDDVIAALINEVLTHTDPPLKDAIEIHNPDDSPLDIGGWYLSDDPETPAKFRIPAGTKVPAKGYVVFDEEDFNADSTQANSFNLGAHGDEAWLFSDSAGCKAGHCHGVKFGEVENGVSFGRLVASDGSEHFPAQSKTTFGAANAGPRLWPVVISEVMYHSANDSDDYLEIVNIGTDSVKLFDPARPANTWKIEGLAFRFPQGVTLKKGEVVLVLPLRSSEARIRSVYGVDSGVRIFKSEGELSNGGDSLSLSRPEEPYVKEGDAPGDSTVPYMILDQVYYRDGGPWPGAADGQGQSLQRKNLEAFGSEPENWKSDLPTAGKASK